MNIKQISFIGILAMSAALATANSDCSKLGNEQARKNCREHKVDKKDVDKKDINCSKLDSKDHKQDCRDIKYDDNNKHTKQSQEDYCRKTANSNNEFQRCMEK
jgi:hypothetical protein